MGSGRSGGSDELRIGQARGPYDFDALAASTEDLQNSHLDLGSVLVPVVEGGQVTVEMTPDHQPEAVYLVTPHGRIGVAAFAAPKSPGLWREVVRELAESLRDNGATTSIEDGHWGREIVAEVPGGVHRFIGVDGPRWMARCVASGPPETATELGQLARAVLAESVVRRGTEPYPPRDALPIVLPQVLAEQVAAAQQQMADQQAPPQPGAQQAAPQPGVQPVAPTQPEAAPADAAESAVDPEPGGALDQLAQATVLSHEPDAEPSADGPVDQDAAGGVQDDSAEESAPRSSGSAMQRFRRRRH